MSPAFELGGLAGLAVLDGSHDVRAYLAAQMDPYPPGPETANREATVVLAAASPAGVLDLADLQGPAGDGRLTGSDGDHAYLLHDGLRFELPRLEGAARVRLTYDSGFPLWRVFSEVVRPLLQITALDRGTVTVHGAAVEIRGGATVVCGWSESGKTETALALAEAGGRFISDKWTMIGRDLRVRAFPVAVGVRDWVLRYLPRLRTSLPAAARTRLRAAGLAGGVFAPALQPRRAGPIAGMLASQAERALALGGRLSLRPSQVAAIYGSSEDPLRTPPLRTLALLTTVPGERVDVRPADPGWAAARLVRSAAFERRALYELAARARYGESVVTADLRPPALMVAHRERDLLLHVLNDVQVLEVRTPFPTDPRRVAEALAGAS